MLKQAFCNFVLAGVSLSEFGLQIPSPFNKLTLADAQITSATTWTLTCTVGGSDAKKANIAAFEALLYKSAQEAAPYKEGIPVSFVFGWLDEYGNVIDHTDYKGFTLKYTVATSGNYLQYTLTGLSQLAVQTSMPVLRIPAVQGIVQPSAVVEALAKASKATTYFELDIDHNDAPTLVNHGPLTTSFTKYVRGNYDGRDEYSTFPGLLKLSKSFNLTRDAAGLKRGIRKLSNIVNNATVTPIQNFLKASHTDTAVQNASFSFWIDQPTMTRPGIIHYKSDANLSTSKSPDVLQYGTSTSNIMSLSGKYDGVAYNMTDISFTQIGFTVDGSGNTIAQEAQVVNSWSADLADVYQTSNIINDVNALASQFAGDFTIIIPGTTYQYALAQQVSLVVMSGNTVSPITGIYSVVGITHELTSTFLTTLKIQRLSISSANQTATSNDITVAGSAKYASSSFITTSNIITPYKVAFPEMYPNFEHMVS